MLLRFTIKDTKQMPMGLNFKLQYDPMSTISKLKHALDFQR